MTFLHAFFGLTLIGAAMSAFPDCLNSPLKSEIVCNTSASPLERANSLIRLMTVEEKIKQTGNTAPGVERLGLPPYQWWSEALHGISNSPGVNFSDFGEFSFSTSFPQPILMGAAFDDDLIRDVARIISTEARAFSNVDRAGLDFWTPNINGFKDPRWGRGQETLGEDAYHLSLYVHALIEGLQGGPEQKYKRVLATCKHWAGYDLEDWGGNERYGFDAQISSQDLNEYYSPPFQTCARDSNVGSFMCSYNAVNGVPTCADPYILQTILRDHWNWTAEQQVVVSDCDAISNIFSPHNFTDTREAAVAAALNAGTDINCGTFSQKYLPGALEQNLFEESTLDQALVRAYSSLIRLGYFDPAEGQPYRALQWSDVNTEAARALAYQAAVEGIVLLKNDGVLPLSLGEKRSVALIGNWANATEQMQGNYFGNAPYLHSPLYAAQKLGITVNYADGPSATDPTTGKSPEIWEAAEKSDVIIFIGGIDNDDEAEGKDRNSISWGFNQVDVITQLAKYGKPMVVVQMGGGQIDSSPIANNNAIGGLLWGGYPGQSGGTAICDIITGKVAPAGRLPITQYPSSYVTEVAMTDMSLQPSQNNPGRTYKWYTGTPVYEFAHGLHYTNFSVSVGEESIESTYNIVELTSDCIEPYLDRWPLASIPVAVTNTGDSVSSGYVALGFLVGENGPTLHPKKSLVAYQRVHDIAPGESKIAQLNLTLGSLSRVIENGDRVLFPGQYQLQIDNKPVAVFNLTLGGEMVTLDEWPQPPAKPAVLREQNYFFPSFPQ